MLLSKNVSKITEALAHEAEGDDGPEGRNKEQKRTGIPEKSLGLWSQ